MQTSTLRTVLAQYFPIIDAPERLSDVPSLLGSEEEFCASTRTDVEMVAQAAALGYIPMGLLFGPYEVLLVKCHTERCILDFKDLHIGKSTVRRARGLRITSNGDFHRCLVETVRYHPDRWLTDALCTALTQLHFSPRHGCTVHSFEVYRGTELVAGEIGCSCGVVYTSLSGFHHESGSGSVQLAPLGSYLRDGGFDFWDLGMEMNYKLRLGGHLVGREEFLGRFAAAAPAASPNVALDAPCTDLIRR